jgi:hypothetical protein
MILIFASAHATQTFSAGTLRTYEKDAVLALLEVLLLVVVDVAL